MSDLIVSATATVALIASPRRARLYATVPLHERFWAKVEPEPNSGCWLWIGSSDEDGYGQIREGGRGAPLLKAHRVSWALHYGPLADELAILHACDFPPCVRPTHLRPGTLAENSQDMAAKGRGIFQAHPEKRLTGERGPGAKLTADQVAEIRSLRTEGWSQTALARRYGVSQAAVWYLLHGKTWAEPRTAGRGAVKASDTLF